MRHWADKLGAVGDVVTFDYPYMLERRRVPDRLPALIAAHRRALQQARAGRAGRVVLAGKSMGGRVGCHVALEEAVDAVVCFGYPLIGMGKSAKLRDAVLLELRRPVLFVQGSRDPLCPLDALSAVLPKMHAKNSLCVVDGGDHSLTVRKGDLRRSGLTQDDVDDRVVAELTAFLASHHALT
jgi:hypothetical protein